MATVKFTLDPNNLPSDTVDDGYWARFDAIKDDDIDYSDIPELTEEFFKNAVRASEFQKDKTRVTMRLDTDVLNWLKSGGKGYQTRANMILRAAMEHQVLPD